MASSLVHLSGRSSSLGSMPGQDIVLYSWSRHLTLSASTLLQLYRLASHPGGSRSTPNRFMLKNQDKLRPDLGHLADMQSLPSPGQ